MIDNDGTGGASIDVPHPVEIPPTHDPMGIPVPMDVPTPDSDDDLRGDPLLP